jgi:L-gulonate 5-dehydrogenase
MKAVALLEPRRFEIQDRPVPTAGSGEVLIQVRAVGICGSDLHAFHGNQPFVTYPRVLGHEVAGQVAALGSGVDAVSVGDRVCVDLVINCGHCYPCRIGRPNCCVSIQVMGVHVDGGFAEYVVAPVGRVHRLPDSLPDDQAAMVETLTIGCQAVARGDVSSGESVAVIGAGPIGLVAMLAAKSRGARVVVVDLVDRRLELARALGADATINSGTTSLVEEVARFTDGEGANVVIEAVGAVAAVESAIEIVSAAGRVVLLGLGARPVPIVPTALIRKELDVRASRMNSRRFPEAIALASKLLGPLGEMVTHRMPLTSAREAFEMLSSHPESACKVVLRP